MHLMSLHVITAGALMSASSSESLIITSGGGGCVAVAAADSCGVGSVLLDDGLTLNCCHQSLLRCISSAEMPACAVGVSGTAVAGMLLWLDFCFLLRLKCLLTATIISGIILFIA